MPATKSKIPELAAHWTLESAERALVFRSKAPELRLGFAVAFKYYQLYGRFPDKAVLLAPQITEYLATQVDAEPGSWGPQTHLGGGPKRDKAAIRKYLGFRKAGKKELDALAGWLFTQAGQFEDDVERLMDIAFERLRSLQLEPPAYDEMERGVRHVVRRHERDFCAGIRQRLSNITVNRLDNFLAPITTLPKALQQEDPSDVVEEDEQNLPRAVIHYLKAGPGNANLENILVEVDRLRRLRDAKVPLDVFGPTPAKVVANLKKRACVEEPFELERHPAPLRMTILSAFALIRGGEVTDNLVDQLDHIIHRIGVKSELRLKNELLGDMKKVSGKLRKLYEMSRAALSNEEGRVKDVIYKATPRPTLEQIVREYEVHGKEFDTKVRKSVLRSWGNHYRRMLPHILPVLEFRTNTPAHAPLIKAIELIKRHLGENAAYFPTAETVPVESVVTGEWLDLVYKEDSQGVTRVHRLPYEMAVLQTLREAIRCREVWVVGAIKFRNPAEDLPTDFEQRRDHYYGELGLPLDPWEFLNPLKAMMGQELAKLDRELPKNPYVEITNRGGGWIKLSPMEAQAESINVATLKAEINRRWNQTSLLDLLSEAEHQVGFLKALKSPTKRELLPEADRRYRLLLVLFALGTNVSIKTMCNGENSPMYKDLLYVRRRLVHKDGLRKAIQLLLNETLKVRQSWIWGEGTTACASDSKKFSVFEQNLRVEFHNRYRGRGIMIYWHVDRKALCTYSQMKTCSSSEVASMVEGVLRHGTDMSVERQYVDTHGQSEVAFAFCRLLDFNLMPRLKGKALQKLFRPDRKNVYPNLKGVTARVIDWALIARHYDEMVKHVAGLRFGNADAETIMRRFTRKNVDDELYKAFAELGRVEKTIFVCRYLGSKEIRREIQEGLNVIENWNGANDHFFIGHGREFTSNRQDDQEESMLSLHLLQSSAVFVNTLMIQQVLSEPGWRQKFTAKDFRAITAMIYAHINPHGLYVLDQDKRLPIETGRHLAEKKAA